MGRPVADISGKTSGGLTVTVYIFASGSSLEVRTVGPWPLTTSRSHGFASSPRGAARKAARVLRRLLRDYSRVEDLSRNRELIAREVRAEVEHYMR